MKKMMLLGDEALAQGAIDSGLSGIYAYPGTPSTEITTYVQNSKQAKEKNIRSNWSVNEKTAMEAALGMSYAGKRAMVCFKHVGLNVAADAFINSAITGANGGLLIVSADDPSMHSSQNEQDSRFYGKFAYMPVLEPSNQQECYDMMEYAYDFSEKYEVPILVRMVTRLAHSRAFVSRKDEQTAQNEFKLPKDKNKFMLLPSTARKNFQALLDLQDKFEEESENSPFNHYYDGKDKSLGIISFGITYNYLRENFQENELPYPVLKISQYPLPKKQIQKIFAECDKVMILEEGYPIYEELLKGYLDNGKQILGRLDGTLPRTGEFNPVIIAKALGIETTDTNNISKLVKGRPPKLCVGCPHIFSYGSLTESLKKHENSRVFADIGCYTLGFLEPYNAIDTCVDMGASITMAKGAADAGMFPAVAVIGDSTFTHSGITGLIDAVNDKSNITVIILDNDTTAMTGGQVSAAVGKIESICEGVGVEKEHIRVVRPLPKQHESMVEVMSEELAYEGVSVIIPRRECIVEMNKRMRKKFKNKKK